MSKIKFQVASQYDLSAVYEDRARGINTLSHPPTSSGHPPSSGALSDGAQALRAQRGEEQEGEGEWKLRQPFYKAAWNKAEMLSQEWKWRIYIHWGWSCSMQPWITPSLQSNSKSDSDGCTVTISALRAGSFHGYSIHYLPSPSFFYFLILHHSLCLCNELALFEHNMSFTLLGMLSVCLCVCFSLLTH